MRKPSSYLAVALVALLLAAVASGVFAQGGGETPGTGPAATNAGYELAWWTVDGGGHTFSTGGGYSLGGTIGQADAGLLAGGGYTLVGGFWAGGAARYGTYLPLVLRQ